MAENILIQRLSIVFGKPDTHDPAKFITEYARLTDRYGPNVHARAADHLIRNGGRQWPTPKACIDACDEASESIAAAEAAKPQSRNKPKDTWELQVENARCWAVEFCTHTKLGKQAFEEGWGRALFDEAKSHARERYRRNLVPDRSGFSVSEEFIRYHKRHGRDPNHWQWIDYAALLGVPLYEAIAENRARFGEPQRTDGLTKNFAKMFQSPLPPAVSQEQFEIDQATGAA